MTKKYLDDFEVGQVIEFGPRTITRDEILEFARAYDPQSFHIDEAAARKSIYGGLIASGWHTMSILMRMIVDGLLNDVVNLGSPGMDELRWLKPVRPGDTLTARATIAEIRPSRSKPDRGIVKTFYEVFNQNGERVMTVRGIGMFARRPEDRVAE
ncbi:MAG: MaoC family dehydratase [Alphaproteobacteria bacterium]|jgi:acyl dehydratase|nr:MaoC family dehydratase [Alphaproteobacteria bacterium]|tara:strand:+ start:450 stop:914 length:465 start_codon:yes stop_codon:yes gene_type:complete